MTAPPCAQSGDPHDGTVRGWRVPARLPTIQGTLREPFGIDARHRRIMGSGRTDASVHALARSRLLARRPPSPWTIYAER